jgi:hypothetical protein
MRRNVSREGYDRFLKALGGPAPRSSSAASRPRRPANGSGSIARPRRIATFCACCDRALRHQMGTERAERYVAPVRSLLEMRP